MADYLYRGARIEIDAELDAALAQQDHMYEEWRRARERVLAMLDERLKIVRQRMPGEK